ncbi:MAG TPA: hypothetical protein VJI74_01195 [Candidatus Paceibacterota bacterium]
MANPSSSVPLDPVWPHEATKNEPIALEIRRNMHVQRGGYRGWTMVYVVLYLAMFFIPGFAGVLGLTGAINIMTVSVLALIGAACVAVVFFARPESQALCYQAAVQSNQAARTAYVHGDKEEAYRLLRHAIELTTPMAPTPRHWPSK